jgi:hypothetical protein
MKMKRRWCVRLRAHVRVGPLGVRSGVCGKVESGVASNIREEV